MRSDGVEPIYWAGTVRLDGHLQLPWGYLRQGRFERQHGNGSRLLQTRYQRRRVLQGWGPAGRAAAGRADHNEITNQPHINGCTTRTPQ